MMLHRNDALSLTAPAVRRSRRTAAAVALLVPWLMTANANADASAVVEWNEKASQAVAAQNPNHQSHSFVLTQLAVHDALNAIEPRFAAYTFHGQAPTASPEAAVAAAAHDVLVLVAPEQTAALDAWYHEALAGISDGDAKAQGIEVGKEAAKAIAALRAGDDLKGALLAPYTPGSSPGDYRATPPDNAIYAVGWGKLPPFLIPAASMFRPGPPPALSTWRYARDYREVKAIGSQESQRRSDEQTQIASFWYESSASAWMRLANRVLRQHPRDLWESARLLALVAAALADGFIAGMDAKYHYNYWRPITAIREGDADGNPWTQGEAEWMPQCATPPVADYPSTHAMLGGAAATILAATFGQHTTFTADSLSLPGVTRTFHGFSQAARENSDSRVYCGIHWRSSTEHGLHQGRRMGHYLLRHALLPLEATARRATTGTGSRLATQR